MNVQNWDFAGTKWVTVAARKSEQETVSRVIHVRRTDVCMWGKYERISSARSVEPPFDMEHDHLGYRVTFTLRGGEKLYFDFDFKATFENFCEDVKEAFRC